MNDTSPQIELRYRNLLLQRSGEERLKMGCSMYAAARALVLASILEKNPDASKATIRRELFLRFYGQEFTDRMRAKLLRALEHEEPPGSGDLGCERLVPTDCHDFP